MTKTEFIRRLKELNKEKVITDEIAGEIAYIESQLERIAENECP